MVFPEDSATCLYASSWHWIVDRVIEFLVVHVNYVLFLVTPGTPAGWNFEACILKYRWNLAATSLADRWNLEATSIKKTHSHSPPFFFAKKPSECILALRCFPKMSYWHLILYLQTLLTSRRTHLDPQHVKTWFWRWLICVFVFFVKF
jgi:hypothetical protein